MKLSHLNSYLPKRSLIIAAVLLLLLSFITAIYFRVQPSTGIEQRRLQSFVNKLQSDFEKLAKDSALIARLANSREAETEFKDIVSKQYGFFIYDTAASANEQLLFWNNQKVLPSSKNLRFRDGEYFQQLPNGFYLLVKKTIHSSWRDLIVYGMIPIQYRFDYEHSDYLKTQFAYSKDAVLRVAISPHKTKYVVRSLHGMALMYLEPKAYTHISGLDTVTALLRVMAFILLLTYIHFVAESLVRNMGPLRGITFLFVALLSVRLLLFLFPALFSFRQFQLFDPTIYGNYYNIVNRSLGDLLINAIFFCWFVVFTWYHIGRLKRLPAFIRGNRKYVVGVAAIFFLIIATFQFANIVRSLVADSKISFNVIDFFSLEVYTAVGFVVLALMSLSYHYFTRILFRLIFPAFNYRTFIIYLLIAVTGLVYLTFRTGDSIVLFQIPVLFWLIAYTLLVSQEKFIINRFRITIAGVLFWIFVFSVSLAAVILGENKEKDLKFRMAIAEKYDNLTDPAGELTLSIALTYLDNEFLGKNFWRFQQADENRLLRDSITSANITGYISKYSTKIFVYDSLNRPVNNEELATYSELNNLFSVQSKSTGLPDLNYHEASYDQFTYITKREIKKDRQAVGTIFIISTPKKYSSDALYPELFRRISETDAENSPIYSYAIYKNNLLVNASSKYPFQITLDPTQLPRTEYESRIKGDYDELWYRANQNKTVIIAKKRDSLIESITLFSYLFCAFLFLVGLLQVVSLLLRAANDWRALNVFANLNIRSQVHSTIIFISILLFLVIGIATISFFITRYKRNNIDKLSRTSGIVVREMQKRLVDYQTFDDVIRIYDTVTNEKLQKLIDEVADIHNVDVNVYDTLGNLQVTSEREVYRRGLLSTRMHPEAFYHLNRLRQVQHVQEETLSSLKYLSIYAAVRDEDGRVYAYLNIPHFLSQIDLNQEISNFLVTIINLNAFIFLVAGIIALIITNRITRSFSLIGDKMKEIRLGKENEEIIWPRNDEIGELVKQYNKMVHQLERSADALARSEREGAWREMARQVAHEIKNPLTPMKLSIQYLQRAIINNQPNVKELTGSVASTLVEQIDHLSKIAADFARFANIGMRNLEMFDLHQVLDSLISLNKTNTQVDIKWERAEEPLMMNADKTHMNRLFTNLITNAIEACPKERRCIITITEKVKGKKVILEINDNGEGIPEELRDRIFTPNFTTKSSGTGLGLAMSKSIVEQAGGDIWFETETGKGTSFYVRLPLLRQ